MNWIPSYRLRHIFIAIAICAAILGCLNWMFRWPSVSLSGQDVLSKKTIALVPPNRVHYLRLCIVGNINGSAIIAEPCEGAHAIGPGAFKLELGNDFYDERKATITYSPTDVTSGYLIV